MATTLAHRILLTQPGSLTGFFTGHRLLASSNHYSLVSTNLDMFFSQNIKICFTTGPSVRFVFESDSLTPLHSHLGHFGSFMVNIFELVDGV